MVEAMVVVMVTVMVIIIEDYDNNIITITSTRPGLGMTGSRWGEVGRGGSADGGLGGGVVGKWVR